MNRENQALHKDSNKFYRMHTFSLTEIYHALGCVMKKGSIAMQGLKIFVLLGKESAIWELLWILQQPCCTWGNNHINWEFEKFQKLRGK